MSKQSDPRAMHIPREHLLDGLLLRHEAPDLNALNQVAALLPLAVLQRLAGLHDMVARRFRRPTEHLTVREVEQTTERLRDRLALQLVGVDASKERDLHTYLY